MAASVFERWIATLADMASGIAGHFRPAVAFEAVEQADGFLLRWAGGREIGVVGADGVIKAKRAPRLTGVPVAVRLGDRHRIVDRIVYPAATKGYLSAVIGNQIDRLAPFDEKDAVYAWRIDGEEPAGDTGNETIGVLISIASRRRLLEAARPLVVAGLVPARLVVGDDKVAPIVTVSLDAGAGEVQRTRRLVNAVVVVLVILGIVGYAGTWWLQHGLDNDLAAAEADLAARRAAVDDALQHRSDSAADQQRIAEIAADKTRRDALPVLERLSALLPDTTYLTKLEANGADVHVSGFAADPASLVPLLENDPKIANVRFVAPLSREANQDRVGFDMAMTWQPATPPAEQTTALPPVSPGPAP